MIRKGKKLMKIEMILEYDIYDKLKNKLQKLLIESFGEDFPSDRIYYKQLPHFRFVVTDKDNQLVGQVGLDYRMMNLNGEPIMVLGIIDLCVRKENRSKGVGSLILCKINEFCINRNIDFILLFADNPELYLKNGFKLVGNKYKWLQIDDINQTTYGIVHKRIDELMIKELGDKKWEEGDIDLLGYLY